MIVNRYRLGTIRGNLIQDNDGDLVKFEDYKKLHDALEKIHNYPEEDTMWDDDRDDAAWEIVSIAGRTLNLIH